jgi:hypothetical protein
MDSPFIDYEEMPQYGLDWLMAPLAPIEPGYRQAYADAAAKWLELWQPKAEH